MSRNLRCTNFKENTVPRFFQRGPVISKLSDMIEKTERKPYVDFHINFLMGVPILEQRTMNGVDCGYNEPKRNQPSSPLLLLYLSA